MERCLRFESPGGSVGGKFVLFTPLHLSDARQTEGWSEEEEEGPVQQQTEEENNRIYFQTPDESEKRRLTFDLLVFKRTQLYLDTRKRAFAAAAGRLAAGGKRKQQAEGSRRPSYFQEINQKHTEAQFTLPAVKKRRRRKKRRRIKNLYLWLSPDKET